MTNTKQINMFNFQLTIPPLVWIPQESAQSICQVLQDMSSTFEAKDYAFDIGCGCGIIAIQLGKLGFQRVLATDLNAQAVQATTHNWQQNNLQLDHLKIAVSDGFECVPEDLKGKIDCIVSNPPVQPIKYTSSQLEARTVDYHWNESGIDGRHVLDNLLLEGTKWLTSGGHLLISTSSRHGWKKTCSILDTLKEQSSIQSWSVVYQKEKALLGAQLPYIDYWLSHQSDDPLIYKKNGQYYHTFIILDIRK